MLLLQNLSEVLLLVLKCHFLMKHHAKLLVITIFVGNFSYVSQHLLLSFIVILIINAFVHSLRKIAVHLGTVIAVLEQVATHLILDSQNALFREV